MHRCIVLSAIVLMISCEVNSCAEHEAKTQISRARRDVVTAIRVIETHKIRTGDYPEKLEDIQYIGYRDAEILSRLEYYICSNNYILVTEYKSATIAALELNTDKLGMYAVMGVDSSTEDINSLEDDHCEASRYSIENYKEEPNKELSELDQQYKTAICMIEVHRKTSGSYPKSLDQIELKAPFDFEIVRNTKYINQGDIYGLDISLPSGKLEKPAYPASFYSGLGLKH